MLRCARRRCSSASLGGDDGAEVAHAVDAPRAALALERLLQRRVRVERVVVEQRRRLVDDLVGRRLRREAVNGGHESPRSGCRARADGADGEADERRDERVTGRVVGERADERLLQRADERRRRDGRIERRQLAGGDPLGEQARRSRRGSRAWTPGAPPRRRGRPARPSARTPASARRARAARTPRPPTRAARAPTRARAGSAPMNARSRPAASRNTSASSSPLDGKCR